KRAAPLDAVVIPDDLRDAVTAHNARCAALALTSEALLQTNARIDLVKEQAREANLPTLEADVGRLRAAEARHDPAVAPLCDAYLAEKAAKAATERARRAARTALDG